LCFVLFAVSLGVTAILTEPSITILTIVCVGSIITLAGVVFAVKYFALPTFTKYIERKINKSEKED
jgi:hypothetical protein